MKHFSLAAYFFLPALLTLCTTNICFGQSAVPQYIPVDQGSSIVFKVKNFGFTVNGSVSGLQGRIVFDPNDLASASFDVSVDAAAINTDNEMRDGHLKKEDYFDVAHYPRIRFVSTRITAAGKGGAYTVSGKLTLKDHTQDISFPFVATPLGNDYIFKGDFSINRRDFGIGGSSTISNSLAVSLTVLGKK